MEFFSALGGFIMKPLYFVISAVLLGFHNVFGRLFGEEAGVSWALSIIGLTVVIRALLIPLFVKQIKSSRNMQLIQPHVKELQKKYGHDRERLAQETMNLYRETKTNPLASCMPLLLQMPIFLALFRLIDQAAKHPEDARGLMTVERNEQLGDAIFLGAKISDTFTSTDLIGVRILAAVLVLIMIATTFLTQRQLMSKNMPPDALTGPYAQQQKILLWVLPFGMGISGFFFPIGVLLYWTTSNLWTMGQQFWVIRNNPAPNTEAFAAKERRDEAKRKRKGEPPKDDAGSGTTLTEAPQPPKPAQRQQPKKLTREQRKKSGGKPGGPAQKRPPKSRDKKPPDDEGAKK